MLIDAVQMLRTPSQSERLSFESVDYENSFVKIYTILL